MGAHDNLNDPKQGKSGSTPPPADINDSTNDATDATVGPLVQRPSDTFDEAEYSNSNPDLRYNMIDIAWKKVESDEERIPRMTRTSSSFASSESDLDVSSTNSSSDTSEDDVEDSSVREISANLSDSDVEMVYERLTVRKKKRRRMVSELDSSFASSREGSRDTDKAGNKPDKEGSSDNYNSLSLMWCVRKFESVSSTPSGAIREITTANGALVALPPRRRSTHDDPIPGTSGTSGTPTARATTKSKRSKKSRKFRRKKLKDRKIERMVELASQHRQRMPGNKGKTSKNNRGHRDILRDIEIESSPEAYRNRTEEALDLKEAAIAKAVEKDGSLSRFKDWEMYLVKNPRNGQEPWVAVPLDG